MKFGSLYATRKIDALMHENRKFSDDIHTALSKYIHNDWGDTCSEDITANNEALKLGERIFAEYKTCNGLVWIITDGHRSSTTILFPSEY